MKKLLLSLVVVSCVLFSANAQDTFQPSAGNISLEVNFVPFSNMPIQVNSIQGRYFISDNMAVRMGLMFDMVRYQDEDDYQINEVTYDETWEASATYFGLAPGFEIHVPVGNRVSPYFGAQLWFQTVSTFFEYTDSRDSYSETYDNFDLSGLGIGLDDVASTFFGFNLLAGVDYYIAKGLYLGAEFGWGFYNMTFPEATQTIKEQNQTITTDLTSNESFFVMQVAPTAAIRLGWVF